MIAAIAGLRDAELDARLQQRIDQTTQPLGALGRIRQAARRHRLPRHVLTSPLRRTAEVGRWLRRWGWRHEIVPALLEMDFGRWDGLRPAAED